MFDKSKLKKGEIYCAHYDKIGPGYIICVHINSVEDVAYLETATKENIGVVACEVCNNHDKSDTRYGLDNFHLACADSLMDMGILHKHEEVN